MNAFSERHVRAIQSVRGIWPKAKLVIVGGVALAHHTGLPWRTTEDMDLALGVEVEEFPGRLVDATGWSADPEGRENRKQFERRLLVDFLPVGPRADQKTSITWPESKHSMTVVGFDLAFKHQSEVILGDGVTTMIAVLPVVLLLKMVAFLDRPAQRIRDLTDILAVLEWKEQAGADHLIEDRFLTRGFGSEEVAAFRIGEAVLKVCDARCRQKVDQFFVVANLGYLDLARMGVPMTRERARSRWSALAEACGVRSADT